MTIGDVTILEGNSGTTNAAIKVTLSQPRPSQSVTVSYATQNGTAVAGGDYTAKTGSLTFAPKEYSKTIIIPIVGDRSPEADEYFLVNLSGAKGATIMNGQSFALIIDDEPRVSVADVAGNEGNSGTSPMHFAVSLERAYDQAVTVSYATQNGTAAAGADYQSASGNVTFAAGETSKVIDVAVIGDRVPEANKSFALKLQAGANAMVTRSQAFGTIADDEPGVLFTCVSDYEGAAGTTKNYTFEVRLSLAYDQPVTVGYATEDWSSLAGTDYLSTSGNLTFAAGETSKTVTVVVIGNDSAEADNYFWLTATSVSSNALVFNAGEGAILDDDGWYEPGGGGYVEPDNSNPWGDYDPYTNPYYGY
jgi:hypothetical protein